MINVYISRKSMNVVLRFESNTTWYFWNPSVTSWQSIDHLSPWNGSSHLVTTVKLSPIVVGQFFVVEPVDFNQAFCSAPDKIYLFRMIIYNVVCTWTFQLDCLVNKSNIRTSITRGKISHSYGPRTEKISIQQYTFDHGPR